MNYKLDTDKRVFFYEQEFYVLSNFSAFQIEWKGILFPTSEHVYHWEKFISRPDIQDLILKAKSAHDAFKIAEECKNYRDTNWDDIKTDVMFNILVVKINQHEYVKRKLLQTGDRQLIEDSWRDDFWGWGPDKNGHNILGKLWMRIREDIRNEKP
jgi:ribA/ribD-fused uncharacterized protein